MVLDAFIAAQHVDGYSINTIRARARCIRAIAKAALVRVEDLTVDHVMAYFAVRSLKPWSRRTYLNHLQAFGRWRGVDLVTGIRKPPAPRSTPNPLPEGDLARITSVARGHHRAWVLLGAFCGLRAHETAKLRREDISVLQDGEVVLRVQGKGGRTDIVPVPPVVTQKLDLTAEGRLWGGVTPERVSRTVAAIAAKEGIRMRYHQLRHRFGTAVYRASGRDLLLTQRLMRHASPATTAGYAAVADDQIHKVIGLLPGADPNRKRHDGERGVTGCQQCRARIA
ncbi:tyrosine-type recombinase/integrase [Streptomyces sp. WI04-05B]|jgi:integrase|uniref:tyrosine-type recombinase/integrase n=1 Tax=Streptomyces TaxID=1883 RepID=UPI00099DD82A|nr:MULTISPECIES: tyrosine-type recombinase/integrase [unclassified Streptomyces]MDX2545410.1 tyrosine-type recombinase/integrase [Streptomyces sp. WI04-05B]MDX2588095.1 tyrosine-type recombinase/integrase [Streptomyces sp. WI04-05A]